MKVRKRILIVAVTCIMLLLSAVVASAADYVVSPGNSVSISVTEVGSGSMDGTVTVSGGAAAKYSSSESGGVNDKGSFFLFNSGTKRVTITLTAPTTAQVGDTYTVTVNYTLYDEKGEQPSKKEVVLTVEVVASTANATQNGGSASYTKLQEQIDLAEKLFPGDYTGKTWRSVENAIENAKEMLESKNQADVDNAANKLSEAISALVKVDRTRLETALADAAAYGEKTDSSAAWMALHGALKAGEDLMKAGDQTAVDAAADEIYARMTQVQEATAKREGGLNVWQLLFFVSVALNAILAGLIVWYFLRKIKIRKDNTPLVDYDIADDELEEFDDEMPNEQPSEEVHDGDE